MSFVPTSRGHQLGPESSAQAGNCSWPVLGDRTDPAAWERSEHCHLHGQWEAGLAEGKLGFQELCGTPGAWVALELSRIKGGQAFYLPIFWTWERAVSREGVTLGRAETREEE